MSFIRSYVVPEGFPDSVTPSYVPYMTWRALKVYFLDMTWIIITVDCIILLNPYYFSF